MSILNLNKKKKLAKAMASPSLDEGLLHAPHGAEVLLPALSNEEETKLKEIVDDLAFHPETGISQEQLSADYSQLKLATLQIRQIQGTSFIKIGEKLIAAKEVFKKYPNANMGLTRWIEMVFGSQRTGFNILGLYEFFQRTKCKKTREKIIAIPLKAAYQIASREADLLEKQEFVRKFEGTTSQEWVRGISERFPKEKIATERRLSNRAHYNKIRLSIDALKRRREQFSREDFDTLNALIQDLSGLLSGSDV